MPRHTLLPRTLFGFVLHISRHHRAALLALSVLVSA